MRENKGQIVEYDCLRVIATLLVVLGHCTYYKITTDYGGCDYSLFVGSGSAAFRFFQKVKGGISLFHMPLFMALSGALFYRSTFKGKYRTLKYIVEDKGKRLMIPFVVVSIAYSLPLKYISGYFIGSENIVKDFLIGQLFLQGNSHLWYCATLFFIFLIAFILEKYFKGKMGIKLLILLIISLVSSKLDINLISYICEYTFWFYIGFYFEPKREQVNTIISKRIWFFATILLVAAYYICHILHGSEILLLKLIFKMVNIIFVCIACLYTYIIAYFIARSKFVDTLAYEKMRNNSFGIYLYSDSWNYLILCVGTMFFGSSLYVNNAGAIIFFGVRFLITLIVSFMFTELLRKCNLKYLY